VMLRREEEVEVGGRTACLDLIVVMEEEMKGRGRKLYSIWVGCLQIRVTQPGAASISSTLLPPCPAAAVRLSERHGQEPTQSTAPVAPCAIAASEQWRGPPWRACMHTLRGGSSSEPACSSAPRSAAGCSPKPRWCCPSSRAPHAPQGGIAQGSARGEAKFSMRPSAYHDRR
jgi:hypothetical protein